MLIRLTVLPSLMSRWKWNSHSDDMNQEIHDILHSFQMKHFNDLYTENAEFREYATKVYEYCCVMTPGTCVNLTRYSGQKLYWTVITMAAFYLSGNHLEYTFSDDYTRFIRKKCDPEQLERERLLYLKWKHRHEYPNEKAT